MALRLSVRNPHSGAAGSWLLKVDESTTVAEIAESLQVAPSELVPASPDASLGEAGVLNGAVLTGTALPKTDARDLPAGLPRLEVVGGPFAGETIALSPGVPLSIGSGATAHVRIADPWLDDHHAVVTLDAGDESRRGALRASVRTTAPVWVNGEERAGAITLVPADLLQLGSGLFRIGVGPASDADIAPDGRGMRAFNRPSRIQPQRPQPVVQLPGDKPEETDASPLPWLSAVIPVILGVTMAVLFQRPVMLLMAAASPVMVIGSFLTNRRLQKRKGERTEAQWVQDVKDTKARIETLVKDQRLDSWYRRPDPVVIRDIANRPLSRLWERRIGDADALEVRLGVTEVDLDVRFEGGSQKDRTTERRVGVSPAPVVADVKAGVVGIAGPEDVTRGTLRAMLTSLAVLRSPRDLQLVVLCDGDSASDWGWAQWLPHMQLGDSVVSLIGNTDDTRRERLREVTALLEARMRAGTRGSFDSHVVVVIDGARRYRMLPGMVQLLASGSSYGIHVIAIDSDRSRLPEECATVVAVDPTDHTLARLETDEAYYPSVLLDGVSLSSAETIARNLCSIVHVSGAGDEGLLPTSVRYTELLGVDLEDPSVLVNRWRIAPRQTYVVVGAGAEGEFALDIVQDGPHALVAGTTGSGKSEFLQALVVSLALTNRPDALNFVLVDYKGGSAFADCERLPHTVGMVTNLDARETERALASLDAELKRRERVLRDLGAKDIDAAWAKDADAAARSGLARLMIVIDEFAELKTELPDFINGLVRIARVGRSLGVNLVLATQRPSGVITPEMQSNINLRVALRVTDRGDSTDVLGSGEAALISASTPGRGFVRTGAGLAPVPFQTARVAGIRPGVQRVRKVLPPHAELDWHTLGFPPRFATEASVPSAILDQDDTDLRALVNLIGEATATMGVTKNPSPWLVPLPTQLTLDRFTSESRADGEIVLGTEDVPAQQTQRTLTWNVATDSHLMFFGGALSGRTTALRTLLAQAVQTFTPADLHLYIADYGNGGLLPFAEAPHTGAVVTALEQGRLPRLMSRLVEELGIRQNTLSRAGVGNIVEQRRLVDPAEALPFALVVVDGWERLASTLGPDELVSFRDQFMRVLREGPAVGIRVVVTADRGISGDKIASFIDTQYVLPMRDVNDYRSAGIMIREVPPNMPAGRVLFGPNGTEAQLALVSRDSSGEGQTATVRAIVEHVAQHFSSFPELAELPQPFHVDPLPSYVPLSSAYTLPRASGSTAELPVIGVGGDTLSRFTLDWPGDGGFVVLGDRGTGRSSALAAIVHQLAWSSAPVTVVATKASVLTEVAAGHSVPVLSDTSAGPEAIAAVLDALEGRPLTVVVDDADALRDSPLEHALIGVKRDLVFIVSLSTESVSSVFGGPYVEAKRARRGLVLSPSNAMTGTQAFAAQIPKFMLGKTAAGGGVLFRDGVYTPVQVPDIRA
ncbi:hypothetical protein ELQ92_03655 [Labedella populi]|uniref:FtsK domain-containing protein n=1 Tax=Labedella populi TaxID=2498850 RepID=A0A3S4ECQ8_9MICO|nr:FtsK/SpoIIIE domain-containing protein [Labedella populi]RWZ68326.1 hypothetical protein ELQ92_03655 [Labedella populi]